MYPDPRISPYVAYTPVVQESLAAKFFGVPRTATEWIQQIRDATEQNMGYGYELLATSCKVEGWLTTPMGLSKLTYASTITKRTKATYMIPVIILTTIRKTIDTYGKTTFLDFSRSTVGQYE